MRMAVSAVAAALMHVAAGGLLRGRGAPPPSMEPVAVATIVLVRAPRAGSASGPAIGDRPAARRPAVRPPPARRPPREAVAPTASVAEAPAPPAPVAQAAAAPAGERALPVAAGAGLAPGTVSPGGGSGSGGESIGGSAARGGHGDGAVGGGGRAGDGFLADLVARIRAHRRYPELARRRGIEGTVVLRFSVRPDGRVAALEVIGSADPALDEAARDAVLDAAPLPPVEGPVELPIAFALHDRGTR